MGKKRKCSKRLLSGVLSATMLSNFCTVFPITSFADDGATSSEIQDTESKGHRYQIFDT